jgi:YD repeat-containing protein
MFSRVMSRIAQWRSERFRAEAVQAGRTRALRRLCDGRACITLLVTLATVAYAEPPIHFYVYSNPISEVGTITAICTAWADFENDYFHSVIFTNPRVAPDTYAPANIRPSFTPVDCLYTSPFGPDDERGAGQATCGIYPGDNSFLVDISADKCICPAGKEWDSVSQSCVVPEFYVITPPSKTAQPLACCENKVAHPIDPTNGSTIDVLNDLDKGIAFHRFYSSQDTANKDLSVAWHHSYERSIAIEYSGLNWQPYVASANVSSKYSDAATACTNGFAGIQSQVPNWSGAIASYSGGNCLLTKNGESIGSLPVYSTGKMFIPSPMPVAYDVTRDDGQQIRFLVNETSIVALPTIKMTLQKTASGFVLTDGADNTEQYDTTGKLLSVTSRAGVVQTMGYDGSGRLVGVTDNFGHQLTLGYDAQNHLISVTRQ